MFVILAFMYSFSLKEIKKEKHFAFMAIQFMHKSIVHKLYFDSIP